MHACLMPATRLRWRWGQQRPSSRWRRPHSRPYPVRSSARDRTRRDEVRASLAVREMMAGGRKQRVVWYAATDLTEGLLAGGSNESDFKGLRRWPEADGKRANGDRAVDRTGTFDFILLVENRDMDLSARSRMRARSLSGAGQVTRDQGGKRVFTPSQRAPHSSACGSRTAQSSRSGRRTASW